MAESKAGSIWCIWRESSMYRIDHACVFRPHDDQGNPVAAYWHASPPWFGDKDEDAAVYRRRFKKPESAMDFADKTWPVQGRRAVND